LEARSCVCDQRLRRQWQPEIGHVLVGDLRSEEARRGDTDDRKRMAVEIVCGSDDGRIRSVLPLPSMEAHHGDRRRAFPVVGFGEQTPAPRGNAEGFEEIAGDRKSTRLNSSHVSISYAV